MTIILLAVECLLSAPPKTSPRIPAEGPFQGLEAGDRFSASLRFSNRWDVGIMTVRGPGQPPLDVQRVTSMVSTSPIAQDPLFVDMTLKARYEGGTRFSLEPSISRVHYFDDRNRRWTLEPSGPDATGQARRLCADLASQWRRQFADSLEREMLEEQLLGVALFLLHEGKLAATLEASDSDAEFPDLGDVLRSRLPVEFPGPVRKHVEWFYREALARVIAPRAEKASVGATFDARGVRYRIEKAKAHKGGVRVAASGQLHGQDGSHAFKETLVFDTGTALVREGTALTVRDALQENVVRVGALRWEAKLLSFDRATSRRSP